MAEFSKENKFATQFGTTTSDGFHVDSDTVRYYPSCVDIENGLDKDGNHASVETELKKKVNDIIVSGKTYTPVSGTVTLPISGGSLSYNATNGDLTFIDIFGTSGSPVKLGLHQILSSATYNNTTHEIVLGFNNQSPMKINVSGLVDTYSADGTTLKVASGNVFSISDAYKTKIDNALSAVTITGEVYAKENNAVTLPTYEVLIGSGSVQVLTDTETKATSTAIPKGGYIFTPHTHEIALSGGKKGQFLSKVSDTMYGWASASTESYTADETTITKSSSNQFSLVSSAKTALNKVSTIETNVSTVSGNLKTVSGVANTNKTNISTISGNVNTISGDLATVKANYISGATLDGVAGTVSNHVVALTVSSLTSAQISALDSIWS